MAGEESMGEGLGDVTHFSTQNRDCGSQVPVASCAPSRKSVIFCSCAKWGDEPV